MLFCPECKSPLKSVDGIYTCAEGGHSYSEREGIVQLSVTASDEQQYYPDDAFEILYQFEEKSFWFRVRNRIIKNTIAQFLAPRARILEVGCGTGFVSQYLKKSGFHVECADLFFEALHFCKKRDSGVVYYQYNLSDEVFFEEFDGIGAFDVLEHIEDDTTTLRTIYDALKPGGMVFITVPADMRLWSAMDEYAEHKRRYSAQDLRKKLEDNRFKVKKLTYFMTLLLPVLRISRKWSSRRGSMNTKADTEAAKNEALKELQLNPVLNFVFYLVFILEVPLIRFLDFSSGSSILCVAMKETRP
jgi:2-polyprenyl-3-methyl-5-hydroxy-6-metoxy-1,4-benzoquinol methylase